jgi:hypothetical protein
VFPKEILARLAGATFHDASVLFPKTAGMVAVAMMFHTQLRWLQFHEGLNKGKASGWAP